MRDMGSVGRLFNVGGRHDLDLRGDNSRSSAAAVELDPSSAPSKDTTERVEILNCKFGDDKTLTTAPRAHPRGVGHRHLEGAKFAFSVELSTLLKIDSQPHLSFPTRQYLQGLSERGRLAHSILHRSRIGRVEQVEELKQRTYLDPLADHEQLGDARVHVLIRGRVKGVAAWTIHDIQIGVLPVSVDVQGHFCEAAERETSLYSVDSADLEFPWQVHQPVDQKSMRWGKIRGTFVQTRAC